MKKKYACPICEGIFLDETRVCPHCKRNFTEEIESSEKGELPGRHAELQDLVDNACNDLIGHFTPITEWSLDAIAEVRESLLSVLKRRYNIPEFDIYPWLLEPYEAKATSPAETEVLLVDQLDDNNPPLLASINIENGQISIKVPEVEVGGNYPGCGVPIYIEQAAGMLQVCLYDATTDEPVVIKKWPRTFTCHEELEKAIQKWETEVST